MSLCTLLDKSMLSPCWIPLCAAVYVCVCERQMRGEVCIWGRKANVPDFEPFELLADLECERKLKWTLSGFWWSPMGKFLSLDYKKLLRETCLPSRAQAQASSAAVANKQSPGCYHPGLGKLDSCWLHVRGETSVCSTTQSWEGKNFFPSPAYPGVCPNKESTAQSNHQTESCKVCFQTDEEKAEPGKSNMHEASSALKGYQTPAWRIGTHVLLPGTVP